jgi:hypothetical protein
VSYKHFASSVASKPAGSAGLLCVSDETKMGAVVPAFKVTIPAFGLCSYAAVYCDEHVIPEVARMSVEVPGVDFAVYEDGNEAVLENERGQARIASPGDSFQY